MEETAAAAAGDYESTTTIQIPIQISVKFNGRSIPFNLSPDSTVKDLKSLLQPLTNLLPRGQKLIAKGKILDDEMQFRSLLGTHKGVYKIQLIGSQGLHQGSGPIKKEFPDIIRRKSNTITTPENKQVPLVKGQFERWKITRVISLSGSHITVIPEEVWNCGSSVRFLDLNSNSIKDVPEAIGGLTSLQKLFLNSNCIKDESVSWKGLSLLKSLAFLNLNQNFLTSLPSDLGCLTMLKELHVAHNKLTSLPDEVGLLVHLEVLEANDNRLTTITSCIGSCSALVEVEFSQNLLIELPETLSNLTNLKALYLHNNGLKSLPSLLLKSCTQLSTLDLHGTQITMDMLRKVGKALMSGVYLNIPNSWRFGSEEQRILILMKVLIKANMNGSSNKQQQKQVNLYMHCSQGMIT